MVSSEPNDEVKVFFFLSMKERKIPILRIARDDDSSNTAGYINISSDKLPNNNT